MMKDLMFNLHDLEVVLGGRKILQVSSQEFAPGKIYGIIGPSGAGKSTLLRVLNLLQKPTAGQLHFLGHQVVYHGRERLAVQRQMAVVFQKPVLFSGTVMDNLYYGLKLRGIPFAGVKEKLQQVLQRVGLDGLAGQAAKTLSGGEAQRLALARAIALEPKVLLLDEPTANLDPRNVAIMEEIIKEANQRYGTTVFIVTHNFFQTKRLCHQTIFVYDGQVVEFEQTEKLFNQPHSEITRNFISGELVY